MITNISLMYEVVSKPLDIRNIVNYNMIFDVCTSAIFYSNASSSSFFIQSHGLPFGLKWFTNLMN